MITKTLPKLGLLSLFVAVGSLQAGCLQKKKVGTSTLADAQSTTDTIDELARRVAENDWEFEIDVEKLNEDIHDPASKLSESIDFFGRPYKEIQSCPDSEKVTYDDGSTACKTYDNAMTYVYKTGERSAKPYVHIIPERQGLDQPEMEKYIRDGDLMVYFYSRGRSGRLSQSSMKWRASHATTITKKMVDGQLRLARVDNPSNYGHPFNGDDQSTFHIFRFMPKNADGSEMDPIKADIHRDSVAKWGTLGYDHFGFASYDVAAFKMRSPKDITDNYANAYLNSALSSALSDRGVTPPNNAKGSDMYCAWFVYMNLNLCSA